MVIFEALTPIDVANACFTAFFAAVLFMKAAGSVTVS